MRSNTFNFLQMCSSLLLSHTLSDFTATQGGSTGLRGSVITMIFVCTEAKKSHYGFIRHGLPYSQVPGSAE
jgi:hypothetical protein